MKTTGVYEIDVVDIVMRLTLLLLILYSGGEWYVRIPVTILSILGFILPKLLNNQRYWVVVTGLLIAGNYQYWFDIDNHKYLMGYWCITIVLSFYLKDRVKYLKYNGRYLIALTFAFAFIWKITTPSFVNAEFFEYTLLTDDRFREFAQFGAKMSPADLLTNTFAITGLHETVNYGQESVYAELISSSQVRLIALVMTWFTLFIEMAVALSFLVPESTLVGRHRDYLLGIFIITVYSQATVQGFAVLLIIFGIISTRRSLIPVYLFMLIITMVYTMPWVDIINYIG